MTKPHSEQDDLLATVRDALTYWKERENPQAQIARTHIAWAELALRRIEEQLETQKAMTSGFRLRMHALLAVCEDYLLWEPRKRGHAEQHNRFSEYVRAERELLGEPPYPASEPEIIDEKRPCPNCGATDWTYLAGKREGEYGQIGRVTHCNRCPERSPVSQPEEGV